MNRKLLIIFFLTLGFLVRTLFVKEGLNTDITVFAEWGEGFWERGAKNFYSKEGWYYTFPAYPPPSNLIFAFLSYLNEHRYILAQIHNTVKVIPADFIIFFGKTVPLDPLNQNYGYYLLLKLLPILSDLGISLLVYKIIFDITKHKVKSLLGFLLYLFNPVTVFLSGVWGQTDSFVSLFGFLAFVLIYYKKIYLSLPFFFLSLYLKPAWAIFIPIYLWILYLSKPKISHILTGGFLTLMIYLVTTTPFSNGNLIDFTKTMVFGYVSPFSKGTAKASISAFNFYTIFFKIDRDLATKTIMGIPLNHIGIIIYTLINFFTFSYIKKEKNKLLAIVLGIFSVGLGSYLFLTNMLERYFFSAFAPLVILGATNSKFLKSLLIVNLILFANLIWAFYRRSSNEIDHPFTNYNFLLIRVLSLFLVIVYLQTLKKFGVLSLKVSKTPFHIFRGRI